MTHVVTANCQSCHCTDCVPACPVGGFKDEFDLSDDEERWIEINASRAPDLPVIRSKQSPLPTAEARRSELGLN